MSTRSQLRFVQRVEQTDERDDSADRVAQVYRHSDGYPESVLRDLAQLKDLLDATRAERGPEYTAASFVFLDKLSTIDLYLDGDPDRTIDAAQPADLLDPSNMEHLDQPMFLLGHGVENPAERIHGDEEYLYVVELPARNPFEEPSEWTVKVSGHSAFPRWVVRPRTPSSGPAGSSTARLSRRSKRSSLSRRERLARSDDAADDE